MVDDGLLHTTELLKTALPYVDAKSRLTLELLVKLYELIICMRNFTNKDITAYEFESEKADMETLLNSIKPKCNEYELGFVDKMLNVFQAKRMFEMYNTYMEAMNAMQGFEGFSGGGFDDDFDVESFINSFSNMSSANNVDNYIDNKETNNEVDEPGDYDNMFEELKTMITPDQMDTFENLRMLFASTSYDDSNKTHENKE